MHQTLHQPELSSYLAYFPAHSKDATSFLIKVDFKMVSNDNECFEKYNFSKLTDSGNDHDVVLFHIPNFD